MNIDPKLYCKYVVIEKVVKVLYVSLQKYLYEWFSSALPFYLKIMTDLKNNVFRIHTYNTCVAKKLVNREIIAVVCHVNYLKVSHKNPFEVKNLVTYLSSIYGNKIK